MRAFVVISVLAIAAPAAASPPTWTVRGFSAERWLSSSSAATLTRSTLDGAGVAVERHVTSLPVPGPFHAIDVSADLDFEAGSADGDTFQGQLDNTISSWQLTAGARARLPLTSWLLVQARAALGGARTHVRIADASTMQTAIADGGNSTVAAAGLGLALLPRLTEPDRHAFHLGVEIELGYQQMTATPIHATPENRPPPDLTIPAQYASLGSLDLGGWSLRIGATIGF